MIKQGKKKITGDYCTISIMEFVLNYFTIIYLGHSMGNVFQTFYTEESAYAKLENTSKQFNYAEWDQHFRGEANHLFFLKTNMIMW